MLHAYDMAKLYGSGAVAGEGGESRITRRESRPMCHNVPFVCLRMRRSAMGPFATLCWTHSANQPTAPCWKHCAHDPHDVISTPTGAVARKCYVPRHQIPTCNTHPNTTPHPPPGGLAVRPRHRSVADGQRGDSRRQPGGMRRGRLLRYRTYLQQAAGHPMGTVCS